MYVSIQKNNLKYLETFSSHTASEVQDLQKNIKRQNPKQVLLQDISHEFFEEEVKSLKSFAWIEQEI